MDKYKILQFPDPKLKRVGLTVEDFGTEMQAVIDTMFNTHYAAKNCAALAATQLDMDPAWRITVIDFSENRDQPLCLVNPEITAMEGEQTEQEACMSVCPEHVHERVKRAQYVKVKAQDRFGKLIELDAEGFFAKCLQHEIDHLNGLIYLDRLPKIKRDRLLNKIKKSKRMQQKMKNQQETGS